MSNKKVGVVLGYIAMIVNNAFSFFLTPLMLMVFGTNEFGVYKLALSITSYFALADLGLNNAIVRYVAEYRTNKDKESESKFVGFVAFIFLIIGGIVLLLGSIIYSYIPQIFENSFSITEINLLKKLFFLIAITGTVMLYVNLALGLLKTYEKFAVINIIKIVKTFVRTGLIVILLLSGYKSFEIVLVDTIVMVLVFIFTSYYCLKILNVTINFKGFNIRYSKKIFSYSIIVFVDAVAFHFLMAVDSFVIGIYISSKAIAIYAIGTLLSSLFFSFSIIISEVLMPSVVSQVTQGASNTELTNYAIKIARIKSILLSLPIIGFVFFGKQFINLWVGPEFWIAYYIALLVLIPQMISALMDVPLYIMWAKNKHKIKSFVSLGISILNVVLTVVLVKKYGIIGAAYSTCFALLSVYLIFNSILYHKILKLDMIRFIKETFSNKLWLGLMIASLLAYLISLFEIKGWLMLIFQFVIVTIVYIISIWFFGMNSSEKLLVTSPLKQIRIKVNK
ncbi:oligosaccharide flippase family protein [Lutibacter sp.]|uniref:oligosaccharide flippase family protein n=1 Tax=Lutibacter sp. TaxID=1925666 RepID=UPI0025BEDF9C|nr:oligosaccharide flippase family protein [Lutibacter sp.]MCF6182103.1 oligosaccharide flippase family protein [Lutibacter sp.]